MKAYKVRTGWKTDFYGYTTNEEIARYFTDKEKALEFYKEGEYEYPETRITTTYADGTTTVGATGAMWYEKELARAKPNEKVELVTKVMNHYTFTEIEIE